MTSPGWAVVTACCTLPPGGTWIVAPRAWPADNAIVRQRAAGTALIRMGMKRAGERDQLSVGTDRLRAEQYVLPELSSEPVRTRGSASSSVPPARSPAL